MISDETPIVPCIVADIVISEARTFASFDNDSAESYILARAENCFEKNKSFRRKILGNKGREYLYAFMRHWLAAHLLDNGISREKIPASWANGQGL